MTCGDARLAGLKRHSSRHACASCGGGGVAQVNRAKTAWKVQLRNAVLNADGKDYIFGKVTGDLLW